MKAGSVDKPLLILTVSLSLVGFLIFISASMGLLARDGASFTRVVLSQGLFGLIGGFVALFLTSRLSFRIWRKAALVIFIASLAATLLVFVPSLGFEHAGARRWISLFGFTFQTSELLKLGSIIAYAQWLSKHYSKAATIRYGLAPLLAIAFTCAAVLLVQPDTDTVLVILISLTAMYIASGARARQLFILLLILLIGLGIVTSYRPYLKDRLYTFLRPGADLTGTGYQIEQSLIAIGSGGLWGKGFGQSVQKFDYLPEPIGDSIFAVAGEEFGFIGTTVLVMLYFLLAFRGLWIAGRTTDRFGRLLIVGIVILIVSQSFMNIASMLALFPVSGIPLLFVSHGGSALFITLAEVGIILNISRGQK